MKKIIFCDLDGTLLNVSERIYQSHKESLRQLEIASPFTPKEYLTLKRKRTAEEDIIKNILPKNKQGNPATYVKLRFLFLEDQKYLKKDKLFPWTLKTLKTVKKHHSLILVTKRKSKNFLLQQLEALHLSSFFKEVLVAEEQNMPKTEMLQNYLKENYPKEKSTKRNTYLSVQRNAVIIGDTEEDIIAGKEAGISTIAVLSGMRNRKILEKYQPDFIVENIAEVVRKRIIEKI